MDIEQHRIEVLVEKLEALKEDDFTRLIVKPLFESMGYFKVEFNGGAYERGKDLIAYKDNPPSRIPLISVVQSKKIGRSQKIGDSTKIRTLISQLQQCYTDKITLSDGGSFRPNQVYLCCPEPISNRFLEDLKGQLFLDGREVVPIDGPAIVRLIGEYAPKLFELLMDSEAMIVTPENIAVNNSELFNALNERSSFNADACYSNLNFFVGHVASSVFLNANILVSSASIVADYHKFELFKKYAEKLYSLIGVNLIYQPLAVLESEYRVALDRHLSEENCSIKKNMDKDLIGLSELIVKYNDNISDLKAKFSQILERARGDDKDVVRRSAMASAVKDVKKIGEFSDSKIKNLDSNLLVVERLLDGSEAHESILDGFRLCLDFHREIDDYMTDIKLGEVRYIDAPRIEFSLNKTDIETWWIDSAISYKENVSVLNKGGFSTSVLLSFLDYVDLILKVASLLRSVALDEPDLFLFEYNSDNCVDRLEVPPHCVFDSGKDIALYGGAGIGKTTTLQNYANEYNHDLGLLIYLPLNRLVQTYIAHKSLLNDEGANGGAFKHLLLLILASKRMELSISNINSLDSILSTRSKFKLILDGLDEAYSQIGEILTFVDDFKSRYSESQLIISSRDCVNYLDNINFLGVTLLPFTPVQLERFVSGWVSDSNKAGAIMEVVRERDLYGIINRPLNATIFCSLISKGVDVPNCEGDIYQKRMSLLCGDYDNSKGVTRQLFDRDVLELAARKVAFSMHASGVRYMSFEQIVEALYESRGVSYSRESCSSIVAELEEVCNVLIRDRITSKLSFGHFRFQEHLVSVEMARNRSIDLIELLGRDWWRGALVLYAQSNDIDSIFDSLSVEVGLNVNLIQNTLSEMISCKSEQDKKRYKEMLRRIKKMNDDDASVVGFDFYSDMGLDYGYDY